MDAKARRRAILEAVPTIEDASTQGVPPKGTLVWPSLCTAGLSAGLAALLILPTPGVALALLSQQPPTQENTFTVNLNGTLYRLTFASVTPAGASAADAPSGGAATDAPENDGAADAQVGNDAADALENDSIADASAGGNVSDQASIPLLTLLPADNGEAAEGDEQGEAGNAVEDEITSEPPAADGENPGVPNGETEGEAEATEKAEAAVATNLPEPIEQQSTELFYSIDIPQQEPSLEGFDFQGWTDEEASEEVRYVYGGGDGSDGQPAGFIILENDEPDVTLYAVWEEEAGPAVDTAPPILVLTPEGDSTGPDTEEEPAVAPDDDDAIGPDPAPLPAGPQLNAALKGIDYVDSDTEEPSILVDDYSVVSITFGSLADYADEVEGVAGEPMPGAESIMGGADGSSAGPAPEGAADNTSAMGEDAQAVAAEAAGSADAKPMASVDTALIYRVERVQDTVPESWETLSEDELAVEDVPMSVYDVYVLSESGNFEAGTNLVRMFSNMRALESVTGLENVDASDVSLMLSMFWGCDSLKSIDFGSFDTSAAKSMTNLFYGCTSLESLDLSGFDTAKVLDCQDMFYGCDSLVEVLTGENWTLDELLAQYDALGQDEADFGSSPDAADDPDASSGEPSGESGEFSEPGATDGGASQEVADPSASGGEPSPVEGALDGGVSQEGVKPDDPDGEASAEPDASDGRSAIS